MLQVILLRLIMGKSEDCLFVMLEMPKMQFDRGNVFIIMLQVLFIVLIVKVAI